MFLRLTYVRCVSVVERRPSYVRTSSTYVVVRMSLVVVRTYLVRHRRLRRETDIVRRTSYVRTYVNTYVARTYVRSTYICTTVVRS